MPRRFSLGATAFQPAGGMPRTEIAAPRDTPANRSSLTGVVKIFLVFACIKSGAYSLVQSGRIGELHDPRAIRLFGHQPAVIVNGCDDDLIRIRFTIDVASPEELTCAVPAGLAGCLWNRPNIAGPLPATRNSCERTFYAGTNWRRELTSNLQQNLQQSRGDRIRTCDIQLPKARPSQAELHPE